jgi:hypothetical protein
MPMQSRRRSHWKLALHHRADVRKTQLLSPNKMAHAGHRAEMCSAEGREVVGEVLFELRRPSGKWMSCFGPMGL